MATITAPRPQASSNDSNSSFGSSQDGRHLSASASDKDDHRKPSNGRLQTEQTEQIEPAEQAESIPRRGSQQNISQLNGDQNVETLAQNAHPAKRPGIRSSLSRILSHKDRPSLGPGDSVKNRERSTSAASAVDEGESEDSNRPRTISQAGQTPLKSQPNDSVENKLNTIGHSTKEANKDGNPPKRRFLLFEDGTHEHNLKTDKRQETLTGLFRNMFKKGDNAHDDHHQLSLMSSWVDQVKNEKTASDAQGGPNEAHTLVEKYGKCHEVVGRGAFGIVRISHKADQKDPKKEQLYAVKEFRRRPSESPKKYNKRLTSEFCISSALRHPNVIHTLDLMKDAKGDFCEVMEYCAGGDLYTLVLAAVKLEVLEADCYFKQLMRGVEYIHEMGVSHRDLKPENLLLTSRGSLKITDFGNGECFRMAWEKEAHMVAGLCGSAPYIAPEEYIDNEFDPRAVDVWACGVIYMAMRTGRHLWRLAKRDEDDFYDRYCEGRKGEEGYGPIESLHRGRCRNVIYSVLDPNPRRRITASQVLKSEWCSEIKICRAGEEGF